MNAKELKAELERRKSVFAEAAEAQKPRGELVRLYREIKDLQFQIMEAEIDQMRNRTTDPASSTCLSNKSPGRSPR